MLRGIHMLPNETLAIPKTKRHLPEIIAMNVLMCMLVIFVHISSAPVNSFINGNSIWGVVFVPWRLATINVRGFIFLSGLKLFYTKSASIEYRSFFRSRFTSILIPYIFWNIIYYLYFISRGYFSFSGTDLLGYIATGNLVGPFYFVIVIIQFYALTPVWMTIIKKVHPVLVLIPVALLTIFSSQYLPDIISMIWPGSAFPYNDRIFTTYLLFWVAGCYVGLYYDKVKEMLHTNWKYIVGLFVFMCAAEAVSSYISFSGIRTINWLEPVHYLYCLSAIMFLYTLASLWFRNHTIKNRLVLLIDKATYQIFLMHSLVIFIMNDFFSRIDISGLSTSYLLLLVTVYPIAIGSCLLWNNMKKRLKNRRLKTP